MKQVLLAFITTILLISNAFAEIAPQVTVQSIADGLNDRTASFDKIKALSLPGTCQPTNTNDSDIIVINYPYGIPIYAVFPTTGPVLMQGSTSARYFRSNYTGYTDLELRNTSQQTIWRGYVQYLDTISVYIDSSNRYVVYVTHN